MKVPYKRDSLPVVESEHIVFFGFNLDADKFSLYDAVNESAKKLSRFLTRITRERKRRVSIENVKGYWPEVSLFSFSLENNLYKVKYRLDFMDFFYKKVTTKKPGNIT